MVTNKHLYLSLRRYQPTPETATPHLLPSVDTVSSFAGEDMHPQSIRPGTEEKGAISSPELAAADRRRILGLTAPVFWGISIALVVILAGAIGGRIGGGLATHTANKYYAHDNNKTSGRPRETIATSKPSPVLQSTDTDSTITALSSTTTSFSLTTTPHLSTMPTSSSTEQPSAAPAVDGCPGINGTLYTSPVATNGERRAIKSQRETAGQSFLQFCSTNLSPDHNTDEVEEIAYLRTKSFEECMDVCVAWNHSGPQGTGTDRHCRAVSISKLSGGNCHLIAMDNDYTSWGDSLGATADSTSGLLVGRI